MISLKLSRKAFSHSGPHGLKDRAEVTFVTEIHRKTSNLKLEKTYKLFYNEHRNNVCVYSLTPLCVSLLEVSVTSINKMKTLQLTNKEKINRAA